MPKIVTALVQVGEHAAEILHRPCFPVNLRLMRNNPGYFKIISDIVAHMKFVMALIFYNIMRTRVKRKTVKNIL